MAADTLLEVANLGKTFGHLTVLKNVSFKLDRGERVALIGPSGSGKSTCLRAINYLEPPTAGEICLEGQLIGRRPNGQPMTDREMAPQRAEIGMVFQHFHLWPHLSVRANVALQPHKVRGMNRGDAEMLAGELLGKVHLAHKAGEMPQRLSGGQQQRVAIARALAQQPKVLLFDEPTSALDPELVGEVLTVIKELAAEGRAMVLVTHEIAFAREVADRIIFMDGGQIIEDGPAKAVLDQPQSARLKQFLASLKLGGTDA
ncbi:ectoine/hydroxyectoine ABC transporter ATP-binding protein EhuA [Rhizobium sp. R72]|uniref:amino acid ABC transporter ATP-binding protein n=1 Tax=unclassified Rhizobium TaxID=2613769 RepID=UPI000B52FB4E|nr:MULTISPECIES: amino acid ABC transporter ATP-binding protein [unclassified Rhizobium]OWW02360.1 ectoine/hydroxyectoine ABC transporter ATP-binding protein EhuA [Rhizobium sp. R72]OWW02494.1 ectoine/hydroxyectoine ABC transporter ATP-binding protein EhuA [Rhizobium sp. R711]